jgi:hypothetical protein
VQLLVVVPAHVEDRDPVTGGHHAGHRVHELTEDATAVGARMHSDEADVEDLALGEALRPPSGEVLRRHERHRLDLVRDRPEPLEGALLVVDEVLRDPGVLHHGVELVSVHHMTLHRRVSQGVERFQIELPGLLAQIVGDDLHCGD